MAGTNNKPKTFRQPEVYIPGQQIDWQGTETNPLDQAYDLLQELETSKAEIGNIVLEGLADGDLLFYDASDAADAHWENGRTLPQPLTLDVSTEPSRFFTLKADGVTRMDLTGDGRLRQKELFELRGEDLGGSTGRSWILKDLVYEGGADRLQVKFNGEVAIYFKRDGSNLSGISHSLQLYRRVPDAETPLAGFGTGIQAFGHTTTHTDGNLGALRWFYEAATAGAESSAFEVLVFQGGTGRTGLKISADGRTSLQHPTSRFEILLEPVATANRGTVSLGLQGFSGGGGTAFVGSASGTGYATNYASGFAGNHVDYQRAGTSVFKVAGNGDTTLRALTVGADSTLADGVDVAAGTTTGTKIGTATTQKLGFWNATPVVQPTALTQTYSTADRTLSAYTTDDESAAYTGIDNAQAGTVYATVADLNALRVAYENLRAFAEDVAQFLNSHIDDEQAMGMAA